MQALHNQSINMHRIKMSLLSLTTCSMLALLGINQAVAAPLGEHAAATEQHADSHKHGAKHKKMKHLAHFLGLTKQQREQAKQIHDTSRQQAEKYRPMLKSYHDELKVLITADNYDEQAVLSLRAKYQDIFTQLALIKTKGRHDFWKILTPEQRIKLQQKMDRMARKEHHEQHDQEMRD